LSVSCSLIALPNKHCVMDLIKLQRKRATKK